MNQIGRIVWSLAFFGFLQVAWSHPDSGEGRSHAKAARSAKRDKGNPSPRKRRLPDPPEADEAPPDSGSAEEAANHLPPVFDEHFKQEYRKALLNVEAPDLEITTVSNEEDGGFGLPVLPTASIVLIPQKPTMAQRIADTPQGGTPRTLPPISGLTRVPSSENTKKDPIAAPSLPTNSTVTGGWPNTVVSSRSTTLPTWPSAQPAQKMDPVRAEKGFRVLDTYLSNSPKDVSEEERDVKTVQKNSPAPKRKVLSGDFVEVEDAEEDPAPAAREASLDWGTRHLQEFTREGLSSLRKRAYEAPLAGIVVNLLILFSGLGLLGLMMAKRRKLALSGLPPEMVHIIQSARAAAAAAREAELSNVHPIRPKVAEEPPLEEPNGQPYGYQDSNPYGAMNENIRVVFDPRLRRWVLKRKEGGRLSPPLAELQPGTVVRGTALGASSPEKRYRLTQTNTWLPTDEEEQIIISVKAQTFRAANG